MDKSLLPRRIISVLALVAFLNLFIFHKIGGTAITLWIIGFSLFLLSIFLSKEKKLWSSFCVVILLSDIVLMTRVSMFSTLAAVFSVLISFIILTYVLSCHIRFVRSLFELLSSPFIIGINYIISGIHLLSSVFKSDSELWNVITLAKFRNAKSILPWVLGLMISVPVVFILISSLSNADPIFSSYVSRVTKWLANIFRADYWNRLTERGMITLFLLGLFSPFVFLTGRKDFKSPLNFLAKYPLPSIATVVISLVILTLGAFIIIEWPYVFANVAYETDLSKFGVATYSEYVKRGFGELIKVSLFVYGLIWFSLIALRQKGREQKSILPYLQILLTAIFIVFLLSIGRRVMLYQNYHGWTLGRIYGGFILLWISGMTLTLTFRNFIKTRWVLVELIFTGLLVLTAAGFNAESFITTSHPPTVNKRIDYVYLSRFSPDGFDGWIKAYGFAGKILLENGNEKVPFYNEELRREIAYAGIVTHMLTKNYDYLISKYGSQEEKREYYKTINLLLRENLESMSEYIKPQTAQVGGPYPARPSRPMNMFDYNQTELEELKKVIDDNLAKLYNKKTGLNEVLNIYYVDGWYSSKVSYDSAEQYIGFYGIMAPINFRHPVKPDFLDNLYTWNWSEYNAYQRMKTGIPHGEIIKLQKSFYNLHQKITGQKEDDRKYSSDLSFEGPFLQPF